MIVGQGTPGANGVDIEMSPTCEGCTHGTPTTCAMRPGVSRARSTIVACSLSQNHFLVTPHLGNDGKHMPPATSFTRPRSRAAVRDRSHSKPLATPIGP